MASEMIKDFYNGRYFEIPKYQRGYAWEKQNVRELFEDIRESIDSKSSHYIGTIVLSRNPIMDDTFYIVDGQQRITTITMIINELILHLKKKEADFYDLFYIKNERFRLKPLGKDHIFFNKLLKRRASTPENKSQRLLYEAYEEIKRIISEIHDKRTFMRSVEKLEVMEFIENTEGDAIRIFQTVNDRGKLLSNMEKAKSLLIYFSNRYLSKSLDDYINDMLGDIFEIYDDIKHIGETMEITLIKNVEFTEDNVMRYHFVSHFNDNYDATATYVFKYLKDKLSTYRDAINKGERSKIEDMKTFISEYIDALRNFFNSLRELLNKTKNDPKYYKLFCVLGVSATLYPLMVKLNTLNLLGKPIKYAKYKNISIIDLIEMIDVRIYKTRGTDPRAEISRLAYEINKDWSLEQIKDRLISYNQRWMGKEEFVAYLNRDIYGNRALPHIFIEYCEKISGTKFNVSKLSEFVSKSPTIEHIASQTPSYSFEALGFADEKEFLEYQHKFGNLTVIEKQLNSAVQNRIPPEKIPYYDRSLFAVTRKVSSDIAVKKKFLKADIDDRTKVLVDYCQGRWWC
ncbi:MAG TPA: DUF262 domain-containing HNH endonuclease family protein [Syntrophobacteraceae bacterium]|nr:DUF262 domain-containing HNH endonuclease family protein [Syntrophobacteraceae bacterium]